MKTHLSHLPIAIPACLATLLAACAGPSTGTKDSAPPPATMPSVAAGASTAPTTTALAPPANALVYPSTTRGDVVDNYHGTQVADPPRRRSPGELNSPGLFSSVSVRSPFTRKNE